MIRFRLVEDERRYLLLRAELYLRLSQSGATASVLADVMRNLGKIESFAYAEGIRQGAVAEHLLGGECTMDGQPGALALHRDVYGSADTPLRAVEKIEWEREAFGIFEENPLEFAPLTLAEAKKHYATTEKVADELPPPDLGDFFSEKSDPLADSALLGEIGDADTLAQIFSAERPPDAPNEHLFEASSPEFLDRLRDELNTAKASGKDFDKYEDLVFHLHLALGVDAGALDLQLSTVEGRTILDQTGFFSYPPSEPFDMSIFLDKPPANLRKVD